MRAETAPEQDESPRPTDDPPGATFARFLKFGALAAAPQTLPSYVVAPSGEMLLASEPRLEQALSCELDLSQVQPAWS